MPLVFPSISLAIALTFYMFCSFCHHLKKVLCTCSFGFFFVLSYLRDSNISSVFFFKKNSCVMNFWVYYSVVRECENEVCIISTFWELAGFSLWPNIWSIFVNVPCPFGKNMCDLNISEACVYLLNQTYDVAYFYPFPPHICVRVSGLLELIVWTHILMTLPVTLVLLASPWVSNHFCSVS